MTSPNSTKVGLIGLGAMGSGMAASLRRASFDVHVFDVRQEVAEHSLPKMAATPAKASLNSAQHATWW